MVGLLKGVRRLLDTFGVWLTVLAWLMYSLVPGSQSRGTRSWYLASRWSPEEAQARTWASIYTRHLRDLGYHGGSLLRETGPRVVNSNWPRRRKEGGTI